MKTALKVDCKNAQDRRSLLGAMIGLGYMWHPTSDTMTDVDRIEKNYPWSVYNNVRIRVHDKGLAGTKSADAPDYVWPTHATEIFQFVNTLKIRLTRVKGFEVNIMKEGIQVGCQNLTHEKFNEIVQATKAAPLKEVERLYVGTSNAAEREALLHMLVGLGFIWHKDSQNITDVKKIVEEWGWETWKYVVIESNKGLSGNISASYKTPVSWTKDSQKILDWIKELVASSENKITGIGQYNYHAIIDYDQRLVKIRKDGGSMMHTDVSFDEVYEIEKLVNEVLN